MKLPCSKISVCVIARDEEKFIEQCIKSVSSVADEIIVADTGSKDKTVQIAKRLGAEVFYFKWIDDFSAAKNFAMSKATGDWILFLDADEELNAHDVTVLRKAVNDSNQVVYSLIMVNYLDVGLNRKTVHRAPRLFRNFKGFRYQGKIHEQIRDKNGRPLETKPLDMSIFHYGYIPDSLSGRNKFERNLKLLKSKLSENPEDLDALASLATQYFVAKDYENSLTRSLKLLEICNQKKSAEKSLLVTAFSISCECLNEMNRYSEAVEFGKRACELEPENPTNIYRLGRAHLGAGNLSEAEKLFKVALKQRDYVSNLIEVDMDTAGWKSLSALGMVCCIQGCYKEAIRYFLDALNNASCGADVIESLAYVYMLSGDNELAIRYFEKFLEVRPDAENEKRMLNELCRKRGKLKKNI